MLLNIQVAHLSVRTCEQWQHGWLDPDAVWGGEWGRAWYECIRFWWWSLKGRGSLGVNFRRSIVTSGDLLRRCVEVRTAIELSFGMVSGVGPGIHVLDGRPRASRGRSCFWHGFWHFSAFSPYSFQWEKWREKCIPLVCEKLAVFAYARYFIEFCVELAFLWHSQVQDRSRGWRKMYTNVTVKMATVIP